MDFLLLNFNDSECRAVKLQHVENRFIAFQRLLMEGACMHAQSCPALCEPLDCSPPGSSVHGIPQARKLEWVAIPFSWGSSQPSDQTWSTALEADSLPSEQPGIAP